ncbi:MAG TPA: hypothetical protein VHE30_12405 [Polyangiaceae bacterium]|nr:hypothetical protein [Polyangiaceae bacterium]
MISNDYGELGYAMYFLRGQAARARAAMALPPRLYAQNRDVLPGATHQYTRVRDILKLVDLHRANVVLLFAGYLLCNNGILSQRSLKTLLVGLRARGSVVVTEDPFLGLASRLRRTRGVASRSKRARGGNEPALPPETRETAAELGRTAEALSSVIHLYHRAPEEWLRDQPQRSVTFANAPPVELVQLPLEQRWLFIIGSHDLALQQQLATREGEDLWQGQLPGVKRFQGTVARLLEGTLAFGRKATLIAPGELVQALSPELHARSELLEFCPLARFDSHVMRCEFVFYWNVFSASMLPRLAYHLPVFFFHPGHMAQLEWLPSLYERGLKLHYGGWKPIFLDQDRPLDGESLAATWQKSGFGNREVLRAWQEAAPTPDVLLDRLVNE